MTNEVSIEIVSHSSSLRDKPRTVGCLTPHFLRCGDPYFEMLSYRLDYIDASSDDFTTAEMLLMEFEQLLHEAMEKHNVLANVTVRLINGRTYDVRLTNIACK